MHLILLSGGSGKRLWPLSNGVRSKQFLKLLRSADGSMESMVQRICRQMKGKNGDIHWDSVTVVAGKAQQDQLQMQLYDHVNILLEPERRDTFPAISYAFTWLHSEKGVGKDETIAVMPVDPYVEEAYFDRINGISEELNRTNADIVLLGSAPQYPTEKFGYILIDEEDGIKGDVRSQRVKGFKEKPSVKEAQALIKKGALWNCGVFGMKMGYVLDILSEKHAIERFDHVYMTNAFSTLTKTSFDYEVVESAENVRVIKYDGYWKDLGTWESLTEEMDESVIGNVISDGTCVHSHVINELDIPLVALGIKDAVVVASHDGILVSGKDETYRLKDVLGAMDARPMYEKKRWGEYLVLNHSRSDTGDTLTKKLLIKSGQQISYQIHHKRKEVWAITHGAGVLYIDGEKRKIGDGDIIDIGIGTKHGIHALTDLALIEIQFGHPLIEEDIVRLELEWDPEIKEK